MSAAGNALRGVRLLHELDELRVTGLVAEGFAVQDRHKVYRPGPTLQAIRGTGQPHTPI
ncbi:hypothetical protein ABZ464_24210 [Streptomyces sp. NPDC005820]|uniref:hypothetical protein n=1 Tax=Streptomyces sp. NPDC005820 TaxID=3157069 RepID=UPI00340E005B